MAPPITMVYPALTAPFLSFGVWLSAVGISVAVLWWRLAHTRARFPTGRRRGRSASLAHSYRVRIEAERRAEQLVRDILTEDEFARLQRRGYLEVRSPTFPSRTYLVPERQGPVTVCEHGRPVMRLCVQCVERVPDYDTVAMHKLMIEANEHEYLRVANRV